VWITWGSPRIPTDELSVDELHGLLLPALGVEKKPCPSDFRPPPWANPECPKGNGTKLLITLW